MLRILHVMARAQHVMTGLVRYQIFEDEASPETDALCDRARDEGAVVFCQLVCDRRAICRPARYQRLNT
jgi:hypothetical protein